jgi:ADP-ribose pyrophosphatase
MTLIRDNDATPAPIGPWEVLSRSLIFEKFGRGIDEVVYTLPTGQQDSFYIKTERPAACVLPVTAAGSVVLVRQFRPGPNAVLLELPGGFVDRDESPIQAMQRELLEETGFEGELRLVTTAFDDAYSTQRRSCFVAINCTKVAEPRPDSTEIIEVVEVCMSDFRDLLRSGKMTDIEVGYLGLDYLGLLQ